MIDFVGIALVAALLFQAADDIQLSVKARSVQPGEVVVLSISPRSPSGSVRVRAFGKELTAYKDGDGWRAIIGIDLGTKPGNYPVRVESGVPEGLAHATYELRVEPKTFRTRRLTVDEAFVTPPASELPRIEREAALLAGLWNASSPARLWTMPFARPVPHEANSAFGTRSILNGRRRTDHGGADFLSPAGTPIGAPNAGRVALAQNLYFSGNTVVIDHGLGMFSMLAHLSRIDVQPGDAVTAGQRIGLVGATGRVTGPHLHWAVRVNTARVDPLSLLAILGS
jgi:murein DD-endopeptidase MepM/ murein hydrolase activator NlpD